MPGLKRKRARLHSLEARIGQLEVHIHEACPIPSLDDDVIAGMREYKLVAAIAERVGWLKAKHEKEFMGGGY